MREGGQFAQAVGETPVTSQAEDLPLRPGDPVKVLTWLANWLGERGRRLEKDWVVITGGLAEPFAVVKGDRFEGRYSGLSPVAVAAA